MRRWRKEEKLLKAYFKEQVEGERKHSEGTAFGKETAAQIGLMAAGLAVVLFWGYLQPEAPPPFEQAINVVGELLRNISIL